MSEWVWLSCDCTKSLFQTKSNYDDHLAERQVVCRCLAEFKSTHEWNIHYPSCIGAKPIDSSKFIDYIKTIGEIELKTNKIIIARLFNQVEENSIEEKTILFTLRSIDENLKYEINEGKVIVNLVGTSSKREYYKKSRKDRSKSN